MLRKSDRQSEVLEDEEDLSDEDLDLGPAWKNFHYFHQSDITGTIRPTIKKQIQNGKTVFSFPADF